MPQDLLTPHGHHQLGCRSVGIAASLPCRKANIGNLLYDFRGRQLEAPRRSEVIAHLYIVLYSERAYQAVYYRRQELHR